MQPAKINDEGKGYFDVGARSEGMLEELEKAHIYIERLHRRLESLAGQVSAKDEALAAIARDVEALKRRLPE